ncbi:hypothetical protein [Dactylosporangium matsuzakiense]|uniref:hypothetical protein n=1 Tax=Dactylosporangium matsuzakiense TaxID=53360 RepID=UPI0021C39A3A|nr:hypothetical protein [Dactylosporangium matsuzakiense]UWZ48998.1 hypothetical protein Dmats_22955 [Dactylosporangium matsuzakiense]
MLQRVGGAIGASVLVVVVPAVVALGIAAAAYGAPSPAPSASGAANPNLGPAVSGVTMCTMSDPQLTEVSGLVATADGYAAINDSNVERSREKIFFLNDQCAVTRTVAYPSSAFDPEDLAVAKDGTLWVADVGDNTTLTGGSGNRRSSIALWSLAPGANTPVIHRLAYPDGKARDAEALIIDADGRPVIITKDPVGEVYTTAEPLPANNANPAPLTRSGTFRPQATGTANPYGIVGTAVVTGAALSPDGKRAVVRTMSDAYEFDVTDGDVVEAITGGQKPRITPLPSEPQGESIAYSRDGTTFLTTSDQPKATPILKYTPFAPPAPASAAPVVQAQAPKAAGRSFLDSLSLQDIKRIVMGVGVFGILMIAVGVFAVVRSRRRRRSLLATAAAPTPAPGPAAPAEDSAGEDSRAQDPTAEGSARPASASPAAPADPAGDVASAETQRVTATGTPAPADEPADSPVEAGSAETQQVAGTDETQPVAGADAPAPPSAVKGDSTTPAGDDAAAGAETTVAPKSVPGPAAAGAGAGAGAEAAGTDTSKPAMTVPTQSTGATQSTGTGEPGGSPSGRPAKAARGTKAAKSTKSARAPRRPRSAGGADEAGPS